MGNNRAYVDDRERNIAEDERIYWHGLYNKKNRQIAGISIITAVVTVVVFLMFFYKAEPVLSFLTTIFGVSIFITYLLLCRGKRRNHVFVTEKKFMAYLNMVFWFSYDDVLDCRIKRDLFNRIFGTSNVVVTVVHTWALPDTRQIVRRARGTVIIKDLDDAEGFKQALLTAKSKAGTTKAPRAQSQYFQNKY